MATKLDNTVTAVEAAILKVYARTNRDGAISATAAAGWTTTAGNVSAITLTMGAATKVQTFNASALVGRHLLQGGVARRISASGLTASGVTALTCTAFPTAPTAAAAEIRDGFHKTPDDMLLLDNVQDRHFQMVVFPPIRTPNIVGKGTGRFRTEFEIHVVYEYGQDRRRDVQRANEDAQAIINILLDDANQPAGGVDLFDSGAPEFIEFEVAADTGGEPAGFVLAVPFVASYTESSLET